MVGPVAHVTLNTEVERRLDPAFPGLRVLAVIPGNGQGSSFIFARRQVQSLQPFAIAVEPFFFDTRKSLFTFVQNCRVLRRAAREFRPDIVHVHYGTITALGCALVMNNPLIVTLRGSDLNPEPGFSWLRTRLGIVCSQLASLRCRKVICVSRQLAARLWWRKDRIAIIPTGVDLRVFTPVGRSEARRLLGWGADESVLLFNAGRAPAVKGLDLAEEVVARLSRSRRIRFEVMRGDVLPERVPLLMSGADCLLVTSRSEGSPNVVKEALACALPVVSVDIGDVRERLEGVRPSCIVSQSPDEIAMAVHEILAKPTRSNGPEVVEVISDHHIAEQLLALYRSALAPQAE
jgi:glycosyltransferase involved in cell wall biosynthesis